MIETVEYADSVSGTVRLPGDKSISHRAALVSLLCENAVEVRNFAPGDDCARSIDAVRAVGGTAERVGSTIRLTPPPDGIESPGAPIDCGNSGTTMRLLAGLLTGAGVTARLIGDESLSGRPMARIVEPLRQMNGAIRVGEEGTAPIDIEPARLLPIDYTVPIPSAQVKSCLLLAGLASGVKVIIREKQITRDHTERMIRHLGGTVEDEDIVPEYIIDPEDPRKRKKVMPTEEYRRSATVIPGGRLTGGVIEVAGDLSTAAYFIAAALIVPGSHLILHGVGINPTRTAYVNLLKQMGANIKLKNRRDVSGEPVGDIEVAYSKLAPRRISGDAIPGMIDELPILGVLAATINGATIIRDAGELRHKESDRIHALVVNLGAMGVKVGEFPDGLAIEGSGEINGAEIDSFGDHRIAMAFAVAGLAGHGKTVIKDSGAVDVSCPEFFAMLESLRVR